MYFDSEEFKIQKIDLSEDWLNIDIEPLKDIGFTKTHLEQIASQKLLLPEIVQNSIYAFSFDLVENNKAKELKGQPINFFMGILRKGNPYASPANYESPKDKAISGTGQKDGCGSNCSGEIYSLREI